jgi:MerR family transcriptional regulator, light-induced transcriptional regulator
MDAGLTVLGPEGLRRFHLLQADAVNSVTGSFYPTRGAADLQSEQRARDACRDDLAFHLEFLRPVLEFGLLQPMVDYLCWLGSLLAARGIPAEHLALSLDLFGRFFAGHMQTADGAVVSTALRAAWIGFLQAKDVPVTPIRRSDPWPEVAPFEAALLAGRQREALAVVDGCIARGRSLVDVELHVIQPSLYDIGEAWQANRVTVAKEHMATAIALSVMTAGLLRSPPPPATIGKRALLACVEGNDHAVGLRMVADALQLAGWDVQYLGANMPGAAIIRQAVDWRADLVGLSVSFAQQLRVVKQVIAQLRERLGDARPAVIIGGLAINRFDRLADMVGADACGADARAAVANANRIVGCQQLL